MKELIMKLKEKHIKLFGFKFMTNMITTISMTYMELKNHAHSHKILLLLTTITNGLTTTVYYQDGTTHSQDNYQTELPLNLYNSTTMMLIN
jgi:hypothetical protein